MRKNHRWGLHVVAAFEAFKGFMVMAAGLGLLELIHSDLQKLGEEFLVHLGLNPNSQYPSLLLQFLARVNDRNIVMLACFAFAYAVIRFAEAYGLWKEYNWAKWLGIISGGIYLPYEFYELSKGLTYLKAGITLTNILIVVYLVMIKVEDKENPETA